MACSSSQIATPIHSTATFRKINHAVYEFHRPAAGFVDLDIVFFHGFQAQAQGSQDAYLTTWMVADGSACWLSTWLAEEFPKSRIMSVSYDSSIEVTDTQGRMDMYLVGENLAHSIIEMAGVGQSNPVVLVGHGVGGLVLKEVCCRAEQRRTKFTAERTGINPYGSFLGMVKGAFFFSTPQLGTRIQANLKRKRPSPLLDYYELLSTSSARLNSDFKDLRKRDHYGWKTFGVIEANITEIHKTTIWSALSRLFLGKHRSLPVVEEGSGRDDMDRFFVLSGEDSSTICKPKERSSSSFQMLLGFVRGILEDEEWRLKSWQFTLQFPRVFIGMPERVEMVLHKLRLDQAEPSRVSLVGMAGIGKSTLAKELLVTIHSQFHFVCYVDDVKGTLKHNLHTLIADNLHYGSGSKVKMQDMDAQSLWLVLKGKKVLLIMDNVDSEEQISPLLIPNWVGKGSRLVATSRERTGELMPSFLMLEVPFLSLDESLNLFRAHVDTQVAKQIPDDTFRQVTEKCEGLPLTIEVIGSYLRLETDVSIWNGALERLRKAESINGSANDRLWAKLRVSFDSLGILEQTMFLELAMFEKCEPNGFQYDVDIWKAIWSSIDPTMVTIGLRNLRDKCFIRTSDEFTYWTMMTIHRGDQCLALSRSPVFVGIHEQLRDMGKSILRPSRERIELCRGVWQPKDVDELLAEYKGDNAKTEALSVAQTVTPDVEKQYAWSSIGRLQQLRLLRMMNVGLTGEDAERFRANLAFLHLSRCSRGDDKGPFPFLESECWPIRAEDVRVLHKLTVLVLENCLFVSFPENFHKLRNLRILIISGEQLTKLPEEFGLLPSLRVLVLQYVGLTKLPDSFLQLSSLQILELRGCSALKTLPGPSVPKRTLLVQDIASTLCMLKRLTLVDLPTLKELPEIFGPLGCLEEVLIFRCSALLKLPESIGMCRKLNELQIYECHSLESLGERFGELDALSSLRIERCSRLRCLPQSLGQLQNLSSLEILDLGISNLPASLWDLHKLRVLILAGLKYLKDVPERMGQMDMAPSNDGRNLERFSESVPPLRSLETLVTVGCGSLESLPESLGHTRSPNCISILSDRSLERLPEPGGLLRNLKSFRISRCESLKGLPECLGEILSLKSIKIRGCGSLERLPSSVGLLRNLKSLEISWCGSLQSLPECLGQIHLLESIRIENCRSLERLPESVGLLRNLVNLAIYGCENLKSLPECLGQIESLEIIHVQLCKRLERLPESVGQLRNLGNLIIAQCESLKSLPACLDRMESLKMIRIERCRSLSRLPESLRLLRNLQHLYISDCESLECLPECLGQIESLKSIELQSCGSLKRLPESVRLLTNLESLSIRQCGSLTSLPECLGEILSLKWINIWECGSLERLPESVGLLRNLEGLKIWDCESLKSLPECLGEIISLKRISIEGCGRLRNCQRLLDYSDTLKNVP